MNLALFDLDHTLIPFDSGMAWTHFLVERGVLPSDAEARYLAYCHEYVAGTLDIHAMHRASMGPLTRYPRATLAELASEFESAIDTRVPDAARALVRRHREAGDLCVMVTATTRLVAEPFARLLDVPHVLATEAATVGGVPDGAYTGEIEGEPCYREYKLTHVQRFLSTRQGTLADYNRSWFYSDSASDLPLLLAVTDPVAVRPDRKLAKLAEAEGWPVVTLE